MRLPDPRLAQAVAWLRGEATRYVAIARDHADRAQLMAEGTDKIPVNPRRRDQLGAMAIEAGRIAEQFLGFAIVIQSLIDADERLEPGAEVRLPATFLRLCSAEDFPGEAWFRLPGGDVVRAPLAPLIAPADVDVAQLRSA